jgi:predicted DCC family thiol-disulfide oxidoreductase YuxK
MVSELNQVGDRLLVIFDGHCGLCNHSVRWLLPRDRNDRLRFVASQSEKIAGLLARHELNAGAANGPDTLLVAQNVGLPGERVLMRSNGVLAVLGQLPQPWPFFAGVLRLIPRPLRDLGYRVIARLRYRIWGRLDACPIPTAAERIRFI